MPLPKTHHPHSTKRLFAAMGISLLSVGLHADGYLRLLPLDEVELPRSATRISSLSNPILNESGGFVFLLNGGDAIYLSPGGFAQIDLILQKDDPAIDFNGYIEEFDNISLAPDNAVLVSATYDRTFQGTLDDETILAYDGTSWKQLLRERESAPITGYRINDLEYASIFAFGRDHYRFGLWDLNVSNSTDDALYEYRAGEWTSILLEGTDNIRDGQLWNFEESLGIGSVAYNQAGDTVILGTVYEAEGQDVVSAGIALLREDGNFSTVASIGDEAPNGDGTFERFIRLESSSRLPPFVLSEAGDVAFVASLAGSSRGTGNNLALYLYQDGQLQEIVRKSDVTPRKNGAFLSFEPGSISINSKGQVLFWSELTGTRHQDVDNGGLFLYDPQVGLTEVVRRGDFFLPDATTPTPASEYTLPIQTGDVPVGTKIVAPTSLFLVLNDYGTIGFAGAVVEYPEEGNPKTRASFVLFESGKSFTEVVSVNQEVQGRKIADFSLLDTTGSRNVAFSSANNSGDLLISFRDTTGSFGLLSWIAGEASNRLVVTDQWEPNAGTFGWLNGTNTSAREAGWVYSVQLGWVYYPRFPWVYDSDWGWLYFTGRTGESGQYVSFYSPAHGALTITNESAVGWFFAWSSGKWDNFVTPIGNL
jgi:hypothetical protein